MATRSKKTPQRPRKTKQDPFAIAEQRIHVALKSRARKLDLSRLQLTDLPPTIGQLSQLRQLFISDNLLTSLPESIGQLSRLQHLYILNNKLTSLPESIGQLSQLQQLFVFHNHLISLPESIGQLSQLRYLVVSINQLTALPENIGRLSQLQQLDVSRNHLTTLPESLDQLSQLQQLFVFHNRLTSLPESIGRLSRLQQLDVSGNRLTALPESICCLFQLRELDVSDNQLTSLPESIAHLSQLQQLFLHDNPALGFPLEVLGPYSDDVTRETVKPASPASILEYYFRSRESRPLNEAKMILVGRGGVGKTSLVQRLVHGKFDPHEKKTDGIAITPWQVKVSDDQVQLNIWDFGGQEIMHATHQFFMTKRSLYLLVIDARTGKHESNIEYWLRLIESFGGDSPVIVVINKIKAHPLDLNRRGLQQKFPNIRDFIDTDCEANIGIETLLRAIQRETDRLPNLRDPFPASWFTVKDHLRDLQENFISYEQYQDLCLRNGVTGTQSQDTLVGFLHDLGIVVNFREDQRLADTHVLNPRWVTNGIYKVLNADTLARKQGELRLQDLAILLDAKTYPPHMHRFLCDLMEKFELGYEFYDSRSQYLVPELLSEEEPAGLEEFAATDALRFAYHYNVLPEGLLPRFIVRSRALNSALPRWRTGAVLAFEGNRALVKADGEDRVVSVSVVGNPAGRRRLLSVIRSDFERIHHSISRLKVEEKIPIPGKPGVVVDYETLQVLENEKETELKIVVNGKLLKLNVSDFLNGVEDPAARTRDTERDLRTAFKEAVNVVFSYSHKDEALRDQLATHLKILGRNQVVASWHDRKIPPGDEWEKAIDTNFQRADLILLLVSTDFIASDYCYEIEMTGALERHEKGEAEVIPIIVRPCGWQIAPFSKLQALPKDSKPVTTWSNQDEAWLNVEEGIKKAVEEIRRRRRK